MATGAIPVRPPLPGIDLPHVHGVQTLDDASALMADAAARKPGRVVVVGSGYIGLELAEAFAIRGASVTVVERADEVMTSLDPDLGALVATAMRNMGITVRTGETVEAITEATVHTAAGEIAADLVVLGIGVAPNSALAAAAGLATGFRDAIVVDRQQRASVEGVWAAGDCCQSMHVVSGRPAYQPLGTVANKQGRVAGINISGGYATFPGVAGTAVTRICHLEIARTGLSEREAGAAGFAVVARTVVQTTTMAVLHAGRRAPDREAAGGAGLRPAAGRPDPRGRRGGQAGRRGGRGPHCRLHRRGPDRHGSRICAALLLGLGSAPGRGPGRAGKPLIKAVTGGRSAPRRNW